MSGKMEKQFNGSNSKEYIVRIESELEIPLINKPTEFYFPQGVDNCFRKGHGD